MYRKQVNLHPATLPLGCECRASMHSTAVLIRHAATLLPGSLFGKKRRETRVDNLAEANQTHCSEMCAAESTAVTGACKILQAF